MALRCLLACSDEGAVQLIVQTLADLGIEAEHLAVPQAMVQVASQVFQLLIVDWDDPDAAFLLNAARERKASDRPMALAIVSNDASVPPALQAGANSILRKPIQANQAKDTLTTAHGLLRARHESALAQAAAAASGSSTGTTPGAESALAPEKMLRAGEFLQSGATPSTQYVTESEIPKTVDQAAAGEAEPLKNLEPTAAAVETVPPPPEPDEPRGLSWYLKARVAQAFPPTETPRPQAELLSFAETPSHSRSSETSRPPSGETDSGKTSEHEQRAEAALFAYITGEGPEKKEAKPRRSFSKIAMIVALVAGLAIAYFAMTRSVWRPKLQSVFARSSRAVRNWFNPQPVTTAPAPASHENFGRAGDEYKLPVAENIPDATTDPSQIRVLPVIDPTAKQPNGANTGMGQNAAPLTTAAKDIPDSPQANSAQSDQPQVQENPIPANQSSQVGSAGQGSGSQTESGTVQTPVQSVPAPVQQEMPVPTVTPPAAPAPSVPQRSPQPHSVPAATNSAIPSSLKSQMAPTTPEAGGNKPVEAALPSIEPVDLPEAAARALILQLTDPVYPENATGQHGTVVLQLLIGRDGMVQDIKFQQGSLLFARAAIDAVQQWKFKPYTLNTRPVSVRTVLTLNFKPAS